MRKNTTGVVLVGYSLKNMEGKLGEDFQIGKNGRSSAVQQITNNILFAGLPADAFSQLYNTIV